ncbi:YceI family protein [Actinocrinis sp.]|uniref:YceI family protein n=1 Tax=Actinocrinis sp. TaxID=1920516 RepID=UPI002D395EA2|nr:YceI family protein [Actinocrinis sp.]HZP51040.1 YceI family protein [Actinocrinis sp.]
MTTETLVLPPRPSRPALLPDPGTYRTRPGRCVFELRAAAGPLTTLCGRFAVLDTSLVVDEDERRTRMTVEASAGSLRSTRPLATRRLTGPRGLAARRHRVIRFESTGLDSGEPGRITIPGTLHLRGDEIPLTLETRVVGRGRDRLLILGTGRLDYSALRATTEFRLPRTVPAGHLRILLAADFR